MQTPHLEPPRILPESLDRRLYLMIHGLPHSPVGDRYVTLLSDLGEGLGWVGAGVAMAWLGGARGRRAGVATAVAACGTGLPVPGLAEAVFQREPRPGGAGVLGGGIPAAGHDPPPPAPPPPRPHRGTRPPPPPLCREGARPPAAPRRGGAPAPPRVAAPATAANRNVAPRLPGTSGCTPGTIPVAIAPQ